MRKSFLSIIIFLIAISLTGCRGLFEDPYGIWACEELGITVDFPLESSTGYGTIVVNDVVKDIKFDIWLGVETTIYYLSDKENEEWELLYSGDLKYVDGWFSGNFDAGKGLMFNAYEWNGEIEEWVEKGEYLFVEVD